MKTAHGNACSLFTTIAYLVTGAIQAGAQGAFLSTGSGQALTTRSFQLNALAGSVQPVLTFEFGFATDEVFAPAQLFDSFSVSVAGGVERVFATLATADASGFLWAPATGTGQPINGGSIGRIEREFPSGGRTFTSSAAYSVSWAIPQQFRSGEFEVTFDLFDNLDGNASLGFFSVPVIVPEPSTLTILTASSLLVVWRLRRSRR